MKQEPIKSFIATLYQIRLNYPPYLLYIEMIITCMFGQSIIKTNRSHIKKYEKDFEFKYHEYRVSEEKGYYKFLSQVTYDPSMTQFRSLVIDAKIKKITELSLKTHPLYSNVDSFVVPKEKIDHFKFGNKFGK